MTLTEPLASGQDYARMLGIYQTFIDMNLAELDRNKGNLRALNRP